MSVNITFGMHKQLTAMITSAGSASPGASFMDKQHIYEWSNEQVTIRVIYNHRLNVAVYSQAEQIRQVKKKERRK